MASMKEITSLLRGQFLIDSEASMRASLNRMSDTASKEMSMTETKIVSGSGVIKAIFNKTHKLNIQHEPIIDLGWPAMTMDFIVADDVDISEFSEDDNVMFQLEAHEERYRITSIHKMDADGSIKGEM